jgi:hypothetical protein
VIPACVCRFNRGDRSVRQDAGYHHRHVPSFNYGRCRTAAWRILK